MPKRCMGMILALTMAFIFGGLTARAQPHQDTLRLTLDEAEKMFLDSNLQLLAQRYNVDAQQALIIRRMVIAPL